MDGAGGFDFHAPRLASARDDEVDLDLIFITIVPEAQVGIGPAGLGDGLLHDEGFQQVAEAVAVRSPIGGVQAGEGGGEAAVEQVDLRPLDETFGLVAGPGGEAADEEEALQNRQVVFDGLAIEAEILAQVGGVEAFGGAEGEQLEEAGDDGGVFDARDVLPVALDEGAQVGAVPRGGCGRARA